MSTNNAAPPPALSGEVGEMVERLRFMDEHGLIDAVEAGKDVSFGEAADLLARVAAERDTWRELYERMKSVAYGCGFDSITDAVGRARHAEATLEKAREALREIARQKLEAEVDEPDDCDWLGGYEAIVIIARAALAAMEAGDGK